MGFSRQEYWGVLLFPSPGRFYYINLPTVSNINIFIKGLPFWSFYFFLFSSNLSGFFWHQSVPLSLSEFNCFSLLKVLLNFSKKGKNKKTLQKQLTYFSIPTPSSCHQQSVLWIYEVGFGFVMFSFWISHIREIIQYLSLMYFSEHNAIEIYPCCCQW